MPRIAEIDRAILAQLRKNGRMSYVDLASKVEASERTVRTHIRNMEENGTIRGYTIREGGVGLTALVRIKVSPGSEIGSFASEVTAGKVLKSSTKSPVRPTSWPWFTSMTPWLSEPCSTKCGWLRPMKSPAQRLNLYWNSTEALTPLLRGANNRCRTSGKPCCHPNHIGGGNPSWFTPST